MTLKRGKILIADDNEDILFTLKMLLRPIAESISITTDPRELLPILSRTHYDVILLDMNFRNDAVSGREGFHWLEEILKLDSGDGTFTSLASQEEPDTCHLPFFIASFTFS